MKFHYYMGLIFGKFWRMGYYYTHDGRYLWGMIKYVEDFGKRTYQLNRMDDLPSSTFVNILNNIIGHCNASEE